MVGAQPAAASRGRVNSAKNDREAPKGPAFDLRP
jgi:hypothetical protein